MYYQPTIWLGNPSAPMLHFLMRSHGLAKFSHKMFCKIKNDPRVEFGFFLFKLEEKNLNDVCRYTLVVRTNVYIRGTHLIKTHNIDVTDTTPSYFKQWLHQFSFDIDEYIQLQFIRNISLI